MRGEIAITLSAHVLEPTKDCVGNNLTRAVRVCGSLRPVVSKGVFEPPRMANLDKHNQNIFNVVGSASQQKVLFQIE